MSNTHVTTGAAINVGSYYMDEYGSAVQSNRAFFEELMSALDLMASDAEDKKMELGNGLVVDLGSIAGITAFTTYIDVRKAENELAINIYNQFKTFEQTLYGMATS